MTMTDAKRWMAKVRREQPPQLWAAIEHRASELPPEEQPNERRSLIATLAIAGLALAIVAMSLYSLRDLGGTGATQPAADQVTRYRVDGAPQVLVVGYGAAWVEVTAMSERGTGHSTLWRIDASTGDAEPLPETTGTLWLAVGEEGVWATCTTDLCGGPAVLELDPATGDVRRTIGLPSPARQITAGLGGVWVALDDGIARIDPTTGHVTTLTSGSFDLLTIAGSDLWATSGNGTAIYRVDPTTGDARVALHFPDACSIDGSEELFMVATCGGVRVASGAASDELRVLDASTGEVVFDRPLSTAGQMRVWNDQVFVAGSSWSTIELDGFSASTGDETTSLAMDRGQPRFMIHISVPTHAFFGVDDSSAWLTDFDAGDVIRVSLSATPSEITPAPPVSDQALDPARICDVPAYDPNVALLVGDRTEQYPLSVLQGAGSTGDALDGPGTSALRDYLASSDARYAPTDGWRAISSSSDVVTFGAPHRDDPPEWWVVGFEQPSDGSWKRVEEEIVEQEPTPAQRGRGLSLDWTDDLRLDGGAWNNPLRLQNDNADPWTDDRSGYVAIPHVFDNSEAEIDVGASMWLSWQRGMTLEPGATMEAPIGLGATLRSLSAGSFRVVACIPELGLASPVGTLEVGDVGLVPDVHVLSYASNGTGMDALAVGTLSLEGGCLAIGDGSHTGSIVVLPDGYELVEREGQQVLIDPIGRRVGALGEEVSFGGGNLPRDLIPDVVIGDVPTSCALSKGPYFLASGPA
jgi:hypothetical protein